MRLMSSIQLVTFRPSSKVSSIPPMSLEPVLMPALKSGLPIMTDKLLDHFRLLRLMVTLWSVAIKIISLLSWSKNLMDWPRFNSDM